MALNYTNIQHGFRKENKLTLNEYVICDMIFYLCKSSDSKVPHWCYMSKETMSKDMGLSKQSVITLLKKMCENGFLEKQLITGFVRTTSKWEKVYFTDGKESLPVDKKDSEIGKESLPDDGKESLPHNYNIDNNNDTKQILFSNSFWSNYDNLQSKLLTDKDFIEKYKGVDLKRYIEDCLAWSVSKNKKSTNNGWYLTLRQWMRRGLDENRLHKLPTKEPKQTGYQNF